ncbi:MAG: aspartate carbamoyltransferase regulatory subunit [Methanosarcinaceae archaeon]|nr:aspartate carbamoyltransferase regulatory subunit [Methanosarcinaceae archaeon]
MAKFYENEKSETNKKSDLRIKAIENGTVIDHIPCGQAFNVLKIMGINENFKKTVSFVMNAVGSRGGKDVVKIEGMELTEKQVAAISLIAPNATVNIIRDYNVISKTQIKTPNEIHGIIKCINPNCITNSKEPIQTSFKVESESYDESILRCKYCDSIISDDIVKHLF